ncbi:MAG: hypothetical protein RI925_318 [Pseudomonadota bacterium]|jgi:hypothetical protein
MLMQTLGRDYVVWDKICSIEYVQPGRRWVYAHFRLDDATLDESGQVVARVRKTLYVRRKMHAPATRC